MRRSLGLGKRLVAGCAVAILPLALGTAGASAAPAPTARPAATVAQPAGVSILGAEYLDAQRVMLTVHSVAMNKDIKVQLLLPAEFNARPTQKWPTYYMLDGVTTLPVGTTNWTTLADTQRFYSHKNVLVVQPIGADTTFFADWRRPDPNGGTIKWETFLTSELPGALENSPWRASDNRAVSGLSMGAYGSMTLAARHPGFYKSVAAYSGYPHSTIAGLPDLLNLTVSTRSNYNPDNMYSNDPNDPLWAASDPYEIVTKNPAAFNGTRIFVSAGNGIPSAADLNQDFASTFLGIVLEVVSNFSSTTFTQLLQQKNIPVTTELGYQGLHAWPYWDVEYKNSWPTLAQGMGIPSGDVGCGVAPSFQTVYNAHASAVGACVSSGYPLPDGAWGQDFVGGQILQRFLAAPQLVAGAINARYQTLGGRSSILGFPNGSDSPAKNNTGYITTFDGGDIFWSPSTGAHEVHGAILGAWANQGYETGSLGYPTTDEFTNAFGQQQSNFQGGALVFVGGQVIRI